MAVAGHKSENVSDRAAKQRLQKERLQKDQRALRTHMRLDHAFVELLHRRTYGDIRVSDISRKAGVGRATFYAHYSSKDDLLRSQFRRIVSPMLRPIHGGACPVDATALFEHIQSAPRLYKALTQGENAERAARLLRECFEERIRQMPGLNQTPVPAGLNPDLQRAMIVRFVASSLLAVLECWVENGSSDSPGDVQALFGKLVGNGISATEPLGPSR